MKLTARRGWSAAMAAVLLVGVVGGGWGVTRGHDRRDAVVSAVDAIPAGSGTVDVTVWSRLPKSVDDASADDLTSRSVIASVAEELQQRVGWGPSDLDWEAYGRTTDGPVVVLGLGSLDADRADRSWNSIADRNGENWTLRDSAEVTSDFTDTFRHVRVVKNRGVLVAASSREALAATVATVRGRAPSLLDDRAVLSLIEHATGRDSLMLQRREALCGATGSLDESETAALRRAEKRHGALADPSWGLRAVSTGPRRILFASSFVSPDVARRQFQIRTALTTGPLLGSYGLVSDSLDDLRSSTDGPVVALDFAATADAQDFLAAGAVVFSGCAVPAPS